MLDGHARALVQEASVEEALYGVERREHGLISASSDEKRAKAEEPTVCRMMRWRLPHCDKTFDNQSLGTGLIHLQPRRSTQR